VFGEEKAHEAVHFEFLRGSVGLIRHHSRGGRAINRSDATDGGGARQLCAIKDIDSANLVEAIRSAHAGKRTLSPTVLENLIEHYSSAFKGRVRRQRARDGGGQDAILPTAGGTGRER
jgi:hypothetical protein